MVLVGRLTLSAMILSSDEPNIIFVCTEHLVSFCCRARFAGIDDTHGPALELLNLHGDGEEIQVVVVLHLGCEVEVGSATPCGRPFLAFLVGIVFVFGPPLLAVFPVVLSVIGTDA